MTDEDYKKWLRSPSAIRCVLVEVGANVLGSETTLYLSNRGYTTSPTDVNPNRVYRPLVKGGLDITSELNLDGTPSISWGDIEISNINGEQDDWMTYIWKNRNLNVYLGDMTWPQVDFRQVFAGKVEDIAAKDRNSLNLKVRDKLNDLNISLSDVKLGGTTTNKETLLPLCFGEVHNIEPLLIDPVTLSYQVHNGAIESIIEVRDNGVPVPFTPTLGSGTFTLSNTPVGTITCSVQGAKFSGTYYNTVSNLVYNIVKAYGVTPYTDSDIDIANFADFETANTQPVGMYIQDGGNILATINTLANSLGAQVVMTPLGKLQLLKINLTGVTSTFDITPRDIKEKSLQLEEKLEVKAAITLNYCKNYTIQDGLQTGLPPEHISLFAKEWLESKVSDSTVATAYDLTLEGTKKDTLLLVTDDADDEAQRILDIYKTPRFVYRFDADLSQLLLGLGQHGTVYNARYGFDTGSLVQIISIRTSWFNNNISIGVLT